MVLIKSKKRDYSVRLLTDSKEITSGLLAEITKDVKLPLHYAIIALCYETPLSRFTISVANGHNENTVSVLPLIADVNSDKDIAINIGDIAIIDRSSLERGIHLNIKNSATFGGLYDYINSDKNLADRLRMNGKKNVIIFEHKIVPISAIVGSLPLNNEINDPFREYKNHDDNDLETDTISHKSDSNIIDLKVNC